MRTRAKRREAANEEAAPRKRVRNGPAACDGAWLALLRGDRCGWTLARAEGDVDERRRIARVRLTEQSGSEPVFTFVEQEARALVCCRERILGVLQLEGDVEESYEGLLQILPAGIAKIEKWAQGKIVPCVAEDSFLKRSGKIETFKGDVERTSKEVIRAVMSSDEEALDKALKSEEVFTLHVARSLSVPLAAAHYAALQGDVEVMIKLLSHRDALTRKELQPCRRDMYMNANADETGLSEGQLGFSEGRFVSTPGNGTSRVSGKLSPRPTLAKSSKAIPAQLTAVVKTMSSRKRSRTSSSASSNKRKRTKSSLTFSKLSSDEIKVLRRQPSSIEPNLMFFLDVADSGTEYDRDKLDLSASSGVPDFLLKCGRIGVDSAMTDFFLLHCGPLEKKCIEPFVEEGTLTPESECVGLFVRYGHQECAKFVLNSSSMGSLHLAAALTENPEDFEHRALNGDLRALDDARANVLHYAVANPDVTVLEVVVRLLGPVPKMYTARDGDGRTPLMCAVMCGHLENIAFLLDHMGSAFHAGLVQHLVAKLDHQGLSVLHRAALSQRGDVAADILQMLIGFFETPDEPDAAEGHTALHMAAKVGNVVAAHLLVSGGAELDTPDKFKRTPLMHAAMNGHLPVVDLLISLGANFSVLDASKNTAMHYASAYGWENVVKLLLSRGAPPDVRNSWGVTPLAVAVQKSRNGVADELIKLKGVDVNLFDATQRTLMHRAVSAFSLELQQRKSKVDELPWPIPELLNRDDAEFHHADSEGDNLLHVLSDFDYESPEVEECVVNLARKFITGGVDPFLFNKEKKQPLMYAALSGNVRMTQLLLEHGANPCNAVQSSNPKNPAGTIWHKLLDKYHPARNVLEILRLFEEKLPGSMQKMSLEKDAQGRNIPLAAAASFHSFYLAREGASEFTMKSKDVESILEVFKFVIEHCSEEAIVARVDVLVPNATEILKNKKSNFLVSLNLMHETAGVNILHYVSALGDPKVCLEAIRAVRSRVPTEAARNQLGMARGVRLRRHPTYSFLQVLFSTEKIPNCNDVVAVLLELHENFGSPLDHCEFDEIDVFTRDVINVEGFDANAEIKSLKKLIEEEGMTEFLVSKLCTLESSSKATKRMTGMWERIFRSLQKRGHEIILAKVMGILYKRKPFSLICNNFPETPGNIDSTLACVAADRGLESVCKVLMKADDSLLSIPNRVSLETPLHIAGRLGGMETLQAILENASKAEISKAIHMLDWKHRTPLHLATAAVSQGKGHPAMIERMLDAGARVTPRDDTGRNPLFDVFLGGVDRDLLDKAFPSSEIVLSSFSVKAYSTLMPHQLRPKVQKDPIHGTSRSLRGRSSTKKSIRATNIKKRDPISILSRLMDRVSPAELSDLLNAQDHMGRTVAHYAAWLDSTVSLLQIIKKGGKFSIKDKHGNNALGVASLCKNDRLLTCVLATVPQDQLREVLELPVRSYHDGELQSESSLLNQAIIQNNEGAIHMLSQMLPLRMCLGDAIKCEAFSLVQDLLSQHDVQVVRESVSQRDEITGFTVLHDLANVNSFPNKEVSFKLVEAIIEIGADAFAECNDGRTALEIAVSHCHAELTHVIFKVMQGFEGVELESLLERAMGSFLQHPEVLATKSDAAWKIHLLLFENSSTLRQRLSTWTFDVPYPVYQGPDVKLDSLMRAETVLIGGPNEETVLADLEKEESKEDGDEGSKSDSWQFIVKKRMERSSVACQVVQSHNLDLISALLDKGAGVDVYDGLGLNALHHSALCGDAAAASLLLQYGADPNAKTRTSHGLTALSIAAAAGNETVAGVLLRFGADPRVKCDGFGRTSLHHAMRRSDSASIVQRLVSWSEAALSTESISHREIGKQLVEDTKVLVAVGRSQNVWCAATVIQVEGKMGVLVKVPQKAIWTFNSMWKAQQGQSELVTIQAILESINMSHVFPMFRSKKITSTAQIQNLSISDLRNYGIYKFSDREKVMNAFKEPRKNIEITTQGKLQPRRWLKGDGAFSDFFESEQDQVMSVLKRINMEMFADSLFTQGFTSLEKCKKNLTHSALRRAGIPHHASRDKILRAFQPLGFRQNSDDSSNITARSDSGSVVFHLWFPEDHFHAALALPREFPILADKGFFEIAQKKWRDTPVQEIGTILRAYKGFEEAVLGEWSDSFLTSRLKVSQPVWHVDEETNIWVPGLIERLNNNGSYNVALASREHIQGVPRRKLRPGSFEVDLEVSPEAFPLRQFGDNKGKLAKDIAEDKLGDIGDVRIDNSKILEALGNTETSERKSANGPMDTEAEDENDDGAEGFFTEEEMRSEVAAVLRLLDSESGEGNGESKDKNGNAPQPEVIEGCLLKKSAGAQVMKCELDFYDATLAQVGFNSKRSVGTSKYCKIQIVEEPIRRVYALVVDFGKLGHTGSLKQSAFDSAEEAIAAFEDAFKAKTGNSWKDRANFESKPGKFHLVTGLRDSPSPSGASSSLSSSSSGVPQLQEQNIFHLPENGFSEEALKRDSALHPSVRRMLVSLSKEVKSISSSQVVDTKKLPLGRLTMETLLKAEETLDKVVELLTEMIEATDSAKFDEIRKQVKDLTKKFYQLIPTVGPIPKAFENLHDIHLRDAQAYLEELKSGTVASQVILAAHHNKLNMNPVDFVFKFLRTRMEPLPIHHMERIAIEEYFRNTIDASSSQRHKDLCVKNVFVIDRIDAKDAPNAEEFEQVGNHVLLWHGTSNSNLISVLKQGLLVRPPDAQVTGASFGKGIYFADMAEKAFSYSRAFHGQNLEVDGIDEDSLPRAYLLLCDVALGNSKCAFDGQSFSTSLRDNQDHEGYDSIFAPGRLKLDMSKFVRVRDGRLRIPTSKPCSNNQSENGDVTWALLRDVGLDDSMNVARSRDRSLDPASVAHLENVRSSLDTVFPADVPVNWRGEDYTAKLVHGPQAETVNLVSKQGRNVAVFQRKTNYVSDHIFRPYAEYVITKPQRIRLKYLVELTKVEHLQKLLKRRKKDASE